MLLASVGCCYWRVYVVVTGRCMLLLLTGIGCCYWQVYVVITGRYRLCYWQA